MKKGNLKPLGAFVSRTIILDTSAFLLGYQVLNEEKEHHTVPAVKDEIKKFDLIKVRFNNAIARGRLKVIQPKKCYIEKVENAIKNIGEIGAISKTDKDLLALGLQLKEKDRNPIIFSEDYSIQNLSEYFGLSYKGILTRGIKHRIKWIIYCPGCRNTFTKFHPGDVCPNCGTLLRRMPERIDSLFKNKNQFGNAKKVTEL